MTRALIIVDVQKDFVEGGALEVKGGYDVSYRIKNYVRKWAETYDLIVATKDFHLPINDNGGHFSLFPDYVDSWPVHCVQGTDGAEFAEYIEEIDDIDNIFYKGQGKPDYSGFQGLDEDGTALHSYLQYNGIDSVDIVGIAGDHCVKATAIDAANLSYTVRILPDMVASVGGETATLEAIKAIDSLA